MKKVMIGMMICIGLVGCGVKENPYEKVMKEYADDYYNLHKRGTVNLGKTKVSIQDLKKGNEYANDNFDLSKLSKCREESYVELILDEDNNIKEYKFYMECEK